MSFGVKTFLKFFVEAFLVMLIIIYGYNDLGKIKTNYQEFYNDEQMKKEMREIMSFDKYNKTTVSGAEVYSVIRKHRGSDIAVHILSGSSSVFYNKKIQNGEYVLGALQGEEDFSIEKITTVIDFNKSYQARLIKHKNDFVAMIEFKEV